jgi:hypothetical protein
MPENVDANSSPPCPRCQSPQTERQEWAEQGPVAIYRCFQCSNVWRVPLGPPGQAV